MNRFGSCLQFSVAIESEQESVLLRSIYDFCPSARWTDRHKGRHKFEFPLTDVSLSDVFSYMERLDHEDEIDILDWNVSNTSLDDVFTKLTNEAEPVKN